ncbi:LysR family transcriptional regulator [Streptomyces iconiensis]|uniref:LysR family transcriptional regulator n=1 Tax=Streptomyces iconiensis TaxID=1384038 RepID=A0ABT7A311_9ACTN|nr:LysR family transcriptional regulator [Streptomyces iconiensis]MDJ1135676.1 LysR family transcriptional regulator [Streptomyces iconiensis]
MLDVRRLRLLRELSLRGTIAAVAEALAFTPSAVSQQLSALEREAGLPLLERTGRRVSLTPAGQNLARHADAVLERLEQAAAELADTRQGMAGPLRIGTFPAATRAMVLGALTSLVHQHPDLEPMMLEIDPVGVAGALRAGDLDVALIHEYDFVPAPDEPGLVAEPLCTEPMYLAFGSPGPDEGAGGSGLAHGKDLPWITATPGTLCHAMTLRACQAAGFTPRVRHQVDDFATVLALVAAGQGVALVPQLGVVDPPPGVALTRLPLHRRTEVAYRAGAARHPAVTATIAALRAAVPEDLARPDEPPRQRGGGPRVVV